MLKFMLIAYICICIIALVMAGNDFNPHGYRYNQGYENSGGNFLQTPFTTSSSLSSSSSYFNAAPSFGPNINSIGSSFGNGGGDALYGQVENHHAPIITKHFYIHSAPEDHDEQQMVRYINIGRPQKNYRVVFIDAPTSTSSRTKIIANVAPVEEKTAIYVLAKKSNALDINAEVVTEAPVNNKPEVFFIKYKTAEEAAHAQQSIQAQYDALGGSSDVSNEGTVSVSSVIGSLGGVGGGDASSGIDGGNRLPQQAYLPPAAARLKNK